MFIEQAIFTSAQTDRAQGYQLVARSPGLTEDDAREISLWAPSHDSLLERPGQRSSTNFFQLASESYCVSRSKPAGAEYSGRGGEAVYSRFLVVPPLVLARFANNPFALLRAATAIGAMDVVSPGIERLEPLRLGGRSAPVDMGLLAHLARDPGPALMATLVQAALSSDRLAVAAQVTTEQLVAGLFNVLPVECRTEFSFSTGLKPATSRPVRITSLPEDPASWKGIARGGVTLLDLREPALADELKWEGWAGCVANILQSGKFSLLASQLEQARPWLSVARLDELSEQVQSHLASVHRGAASAAVASQPAVSSDEPPRQNNERFEAAHQRKRSASVAQRGPAEVAQATSRSTTAGQVPEVLELLERVDELVFAAIGGDDRAVTELEVLWPLIVADLDEDLVEQSREQYLRCALSICRECVDGEVERPERAAAAIDVLCVLFEE